MCQCHYAKVFCYCCSKKKGEPAGAGALILSAMVNCIVVRNKKKNFLLVDGHGSVFCMSIPNICNYFFNLRDAISR